MNVIELLVEGDLLSFFIKLFGIVLGLLYLFFSVIMIKQVTTMKKTITLDDGGLLLFAAYIQTIFASVIVFYALFIL